MGRVTVAYVATTSQHWCDHIVVPCVALDGTSIVHHHRPSTSKHPNMAASSVLLLLIHCPQLGRVATIIVDRSRLLSAICYRYIYDGLIFSSWIPSYSPLRSSSSHFEFPGFSSVRRSYVRTHTATICWRLTLFCNLQKLFNMRRSVSDRAVSTVGCWLWG
eukprot:scaffold317268_cov35-Attheya_sp.AAC.1